MSPHSISNHQSTTSSNILKPEMEIAMAQRFSLSFWEDRSFSVKLPLLASETSFFVLNHFPTPPGPFDGFEDGPLCRYEQGLQNMQRAQDKGQ